MSNAVSIAVAWGAVFGVFGLYLLSILRRTRSTSSLVPADRQRWMTTDDAEAPGEREESTTS